MNQRDQQFMVQKIRAEYMEKESSGLDQLRALDKKVKRPANLFGYLFGSLSALIAGAGMSLVMTEIGMVVGIASPMIPSIVIGIVGMALAALNYPIYKRILSARRKKYAPEILSLSESIANETVSMK